MIFWLPIVGFFGLEIGYGFMPDAMQGEWFATIGQWELVVVAWLAFLCVGYENTYRKATVFILLLWTLLIAATDGFVSWYPSWGMVPEALFVAALIGKVAHAVSRRQKAE